MNLLTQTQINAYERCKRLYYLKYVRRLVWPVETTARRNVDQGESFHLLVRQLLMGFPREKLLFPGGDEEVSRWIGVFLQARPLDGARHVMAEKELSALLADVLWLGKFDALAVKDDRLVIYDWKTGKAVPDAARYHASPQTRLYRFLAKMNACRLPGSALHEIPAENIEMIYWFPEYPDQPVRLPYSEEEFQQDVTWLHMTAREMCAGDEADYPRTVITKRCRFCDYRTYCFPESPVYPEDQELSEQDGEPADEIFQTDFFSVEGFSDTDREETVF